MSTNKTGDKLESINKLFIPDGICRHNDTDELINVCFICMSVSL